MNRPNALVQKRKNICRTNTNRRAEKEKGYSYKKLHNATLLHQVVDISKVQTYLVFVVAVLGRVLISPIRIQWKTVALHGTRTLWINTYRIRKEWFREWRWFLQELKRKVIVKTWFIIFATASTDYYICNYALAHRLKITQIHSIFKGFSCLLFEFYKW